MGTGRKAGRDTPEVVVEGLVGKAARLPTSLRGLIRANQAKEDPLKWAIKQIPGGTRAVWALLRLSDDPEAVRIIEAHNRISNDPAGAGDPAVREVLEQCDMTPRDFVGVVSRVAFDFNVTLGRSIAAMHYPKMMKVSMKRAQDPEATDERKLHLQASGYLPSPRGIRIGIRNTNVVDVPDDAPPVPGRPVSFDRTARQVVRELPPVK